MSPTLLALTIPESVYEQYATVLTQEERGNAVVVLGSFKQLPKINKTIAIFQENDLRVLAPRLSYIISETDGFPVLKSDQDTIKRLLADYPDQAETWYHAVLERIFMAHIQQVRHIYIVDEGGYAGTTVAMEIGFARAVPGVNIKALEPIDPKLDWNDGFDYWSGAIWAGCVMDIETMSPQDFIASIRADHKDFKNI